MAKTKYLTSPPKITDHAAGRALYRRQRSGRALLLLRDEFHPDHLHDQVPPRPDGAPEHDAGGTGRGVVSHLRLVALYFADRRSGPGRRGLREVLGRFLDLDCLLRRTRRPSVDWFADRARDRASLSPRDRPLLNRDWRRRNQAVRLDQRGRSIWRNEPALAHSCL